MVTAAQSPAFPCRGDNVKLFPAAVGFRGPRRLRGRPELPAQAHRWWEVPPGTVLAASWPPRARGRERGLTRVPGQSEEARMPPVQTSRRPLRNRYPKAAGGHGPPCSKARLPRRTPGVGTVTPCLMDKCEPRKSY